MDWWFPGSKEVFGIFLDLKQELIASGMGMTLLLTLLAQKQTMPSQLNLFSQKAWFTMLL